MNTSAVRQRRLRARRREGRIPLLVEPQEFELIERLVAIGDLDPKDQGDRAALVAALNRTLDKWLEQ